MLSRPERKLALPLIAVSLIPLIVGSSAAWYLHQQQRRASELLHESIESVQAAQELESMVGELKSRLNEYAITGEGQHLKAAAGLQDEARRRIDRVEVLEFTNEGQLFVRQFRREYDAFQDGLARAARAQNKQAIVELIDGLRTGDLVEQTQQHRQDRARRLRYAEAESTAAAERAGWILLLLGVCGTMAGTLAGVGITRGFQKTITELHVPVRNAAGALDSVVGPITVSASGDVDQLHAELEGLAERVSAVVSRLQESQRETLRAEQLSALGQLAAGLAHELRNPLTAMKTLVQSARERGGVSALDETDLDVLEEEITRLNESVQTFLDYARPPKIERRAVHVRDVVDSSVQLVSARAELQKIRVVTDVADDIPEVEADPDQLHQVLVNLILNAMDAQPGGGEVLVRAAVRDGIDDDAPSMLQLEVVDQGPGIRPDVYERIFEPFVSTKDAGTGLGLSISSRIIREHGGTITAENRPGRGAAFIIRLPLDDRQPIVQNLESALPVRQGE